MRLKTYCIWFTLFVVVASCRKQDLSLTDKLSFTSESLVRISEDNMITKITDTGDYYYLELEDGTTITVRKKLVLSVIDGDWKVTLVFFDQSSIVLPKIGKTINYTTNGPKDDTPLMAGFKTVAPYKGILTYEVTGQDGEVSSYKSESFAIRDSLDVKVIGLYPEFKNQVVVKYLSSRGKLRATFTFDVQTSKLNQLNDTKIVVKKSESIVVQNEFFMAQLRSNNYTIMVDQFGKVRWISSKKILFPGYGLQRLRNGNFAIGAGDKIYEYNIYNEIVRTYDISSRYKNVHHDFIELPNGDFICTVDKVGAKTTEDYLIRLDRASSDVIGVWDLNISIPRRYNLIKDTVDWLHVNAISFDSSDSTIWVSGQRSGLFGISFDNKLRYIYSDPRGFEASTSYLMTDLSNSYVWGQHNIQSLGNNLFSIFDNGYGRNFSNTPQYSRAMILEKNSYTFRVVWEFGKDLPEYYSPIISGVDVDKADNSKLVCFGSTGFDLTYKDSLSSPIVINANGNYNLSAALVKINSTGSVTSQIEFLSTSPIGIYRAKIIRL